MDARNPTIVFFGAAVELLSYVAPGDFHPGLLVKSKLALGVAVFGHHGI